MKLLVASGAPTALGLFNRNLLGHLVLLLLLEGCSGSVLASRARQLENLLHLLSASRSDRLRTERLLLLLLVLLIRMRLRVRRLLLAIVDRRVDEAHGSFSARVLASVS